MPTDANLVLATLATVTATTHGSAVILPGGTPRRGLNARVIYSAANQASGSGVFTFSIDVCYDGVPTLWNVDFVAPVITLTTSNQSGEIFIPFSISPTSVANGTQIRLSATLSGSPTTPTITYAGYVTLGRP
jgi:hypothetical protein